MRERMITVVFGITLLVIVLLFYTTILFNIAIAAVAVLAVIEIYSSTVKGKSTGFFVISLAFAAAVPFLSYLKFQNSAVVAGFVFMLALFLYMLYGHRKLPLSQMATTAFMELLVLISMGSFIAIRDTFKSSGRLADVGLFYIALVFATAWMTDVGGYLFGRLFGRHKMSPQISPKKTVEGAVGGVLLSVISAVLLLYIYSMYLSFAGVHASYNYAAVILLTLVCALLSIAGDLTASLLKRENGIKDFGNILPGHGGILDRFDSILFVSPLICFWITTFPLVKLY